jgi:hypothetical protein
VVAKTLGIALDTKDGRAKVMALLEMWTRSGCLYEEPEYDEKQRKSKKFIRVRDDAEE